MFRITADWLRCADACGDARGLFGDREYTLQEALDLVLTTDHEEWCRWGVETLLRSIGGRKVCAFAARRARSVEYLWPPELYGACDAAVRCAERVAAGEHVRPGECLAARVRLEVTTQEPYGLRPRAQWMACKVVWYTVGTALEVALAPDDEQTTFWCVSAAADTAYYVVRVATEDAGRTKLEAWRSIASDLQALLDRPTKCRGQDS